MFWVLGESDLFVVVGDFINVIKVGFLIFEWICVEGLFFIIKVCKGRVVVGCFGSNIVWLIFFGWIVNKIGWYLVCVGCLLENMVGVVKEIGYWFDDVMVIMFSYVGYLLLEEVLVVVMGS